MEQKRGFKSLSPRECGEVFPSVIDNAERHFSMAQHISTIYAYPNAVAHLILGAEELVKATLLILRSKHILLLNTTGHDFLNLKYAAGNTTLKDFFSVWIGFKELLNVDRTQEQFTLKYLVNMVVNGFAGIIKGKENFKWWDEADILKQNCLYVDFKGGLLLPDYQVGKSEYNQAHHHIYVFRYEFYLLHHKLLNFSEEELFEFREQLKEGVFAEILGNAFKLIDSE